MSAGRGGARGIGTRDGAGRRERRRTAARNSRGWREGSKVTLLMGPPMKTKKNPQSAKTRRMSWDGSRRACGARDGDQRRVLTVCKQRCSCWPPRRGSAVRVPAGLPRAERTQLYIMESRRALSSLTGRWSLGMPCGDDEGFAGGRLHTEHWCTASAIRHRHSRPGIACELLPAADPCFASHQLLHCAGQRKPGFSNLIFTTLSPITSQGGDRM